MRILKRKYTTNGMIVSINYFTPEYYNDNGFFTLTLGYEDKDSDSGDHNMISIIINKDMNLEWLWRDYKRFIQTFNIWNNEYIHVDKYNKVCDELTSLKAQLKKLNR